MADEDDIEDTGTSLLKPVYHDEDLGSLLQSFNDPHFSSQTSEDLGSNMQFLRNLQSSSQTGVHLGSDMQPVSNLQSNSRTVKHVESNMQPLRNVQSSSQAGAHLESNMQPLSNLQSNSRTVEHIGSNVQPLNNMQSNSQAGEYFGSNMQPVRNQQCNSRVGEYLVSNMQPLRNLQPNIPTGSQPTRNKRKEASPCHNNYPPTEQPQQLVVSLPAPTRTNCNVARAPFPTNNILPSQSLLNPCSIQAPSYQLPCFIPPNQAAISSQQRPRVQQQSVHMIPSIGNQQISAYPHSAGQLNSLSSSYQVQQSAPPPMTNFSYASFQSSQEVNMKPYLWNTEERYDLVMSEALTNLKFENLYQLNDLLQSELSDCKSYIGRLETEVNSLKQLQGQMDEFKSEIRRLEAELYDWKQSQGQIANDILCISAWKASEKSITGKPPIPLDDTLPSTHSASNVFLEKASQDDRRIGDSFKLDEQSLLVHTGSDPSTTSRKKIKAGEESKGSLNVAAREGSPVTDVQRDEFTTELGIVQGEKEKAYTSVNGKSGDFPVCYQSSGDEDLEAFSDEILRLLES